LSVPAHRLAWRVGTLVDASRETETARTLVLDVPGWPGHLAGQHVILRLTAEDGYTAQRSYSLASPPDADRIEITVQRLADGEVSPYLTDVMEPGDQLEVRGPIGGWFVWDPTSRAPVQLLAGGSGIVPLMSMVRARAQAGSTTPFRLVYSVRSPDQIIYGPELAKRAAAGDGFELTYVYTRTAPPGSDRPAGRISTRDLAIEGWEPAQRPAVFVCGPTGYVEAVASTLTSAGHDAGRIKTERFGPTGS
jgi:ferredoxin-NADP reductase